MLHTMLPVQYLRAGDAGLAAPQRRLMVAVLQTALDDCRGTAYARSAGAGAVVPTDPRALTQAVAYVRSRDRSWPYSFDNICEAIGLDADGIRRAVIGHISEAS